MVGGNEEVDGVEEVGKNDGGWGETVCEGKPMARAIVMVETLCFLDPHPPFSIQCLQQNRRGQSSARRV